MDCPRVQRRKDTTLRNKTKKIQTRGTIKDSVPYRREKQSSEVGSPALRPGGCWGEDGAPRRRRRWGARRMDCGAGKGETRVGEGIIIGCFVLLFLRKSREGRGILLFKWFWIYSTVLYMKPSGSVVVGGVGPDKRLRVETCPDTRDDNLCWLLLWGACRRARTTTTPRPQVLPVLNYLLCF